MHPRSESPRVSAREAASLVALLLVYLAVLINLAGRTGVTVDEPSHILSAILYWEGNDRLLPRDMPPLIKLAGGWAAAGGQFRIVEESHPVWKTNHEWSISQDMMRRMDEREIRESMFRARLPILIFPIATACLIWWWARQLLSPWTGILLAAMFAAEPTALGHAALFKNDHAATFTCLLFWYRAWRFWQTRSWSDAIWLSCAASLALLAKLSMAVLLVALPLILLARKPASLLVAVPLVYGIVCLACQFEVRTLHPDEIRIRPWLNSIFAVLPPPMPIWTGIMALLHNTDQENAVYLLGKRYPWGHPGYFGFAALVKAPEVVLLLIAAGAAALVGRWRMVRGSDLFWIVPGPLYFTLASISALQLGFRLVLPCLPFALLLAGQALTRMRPAVASACLALIIAGSAWRYPHCLSYFNFLSGGPAKGTVYLSDSNVDWGQALLELRRWMRQSKTGSIHLSYFGTDNLMAYFPPHEVTWIPPPFEGSQRPPSLRYEPSPGIYAISATLLTGQFFPEPYRDYYRAFREKHPIGYAGYAIYIYRFP